MAQKVGAFQLLGIASGLLSGLVSEAPLSALRASNHTVSIKIKFAIVLQNDLVSYLQCPIVALNPSVSNSPRSALCRASMNYLIPQNITVNGQECEVTLQNDVSGSALYLLWARYYLYYFIMSLLCSSAPIFWGLCY